MNEWNVPDWRDESAYSDLAFTLLRWRWEFLRRHLDFRVEFDAVAWAEYEDRKRIYDETMANGDELTGTEFGPLTFLPLEEPLRPYEVGFYLECRNPGTYNTRVLLNPRIADQPEELLMFCSPELEQPARSKYMRLGEDFQAKGNSLVVEFDLERPLEPQIEFAKRELKVWGRLAPRKKPKNTRLWRSYLRILDARNDGASWREIASLLPGSKSSRTAQNARDVHRQALALCFGV